MQELNFYKNSKMVNKMEWYKSKLLKKLFLETTDWNVAWKKENDNIYTLINNPVGFWLADSLVFSCDEGTFLFVEAFDKNENIGKLAVLKFNGEEFSDFQIILEKDYHLSYPYVFEYNKQYYMIPETSGNNCIELYISETFPYKWKKIKTIFEGKYVDTSVCNLDKEKFLLYSYDLENKKLMKSILNMDNFSIDNIELTNDTNNALRAGGNIFPHKDGNVRALQNNEYFYGQKLNIIDDNNNIIFKIDPRDILTNDKKIYKRLHTYSKSGEFEAIDLSSYRFNLLKFVKKIFK